MMSSSLKLIIAILLLVISVNVLAATVQSLTLPLTLGYESNPQFLVNNKKSINRVTLNPGYSITSTQGANQWFTNASLSLVRTSDQTISQDRNDPSLNLGWKHDYETGQFGVTGFLNEQSTRVSEFTDSGLVSGDNTKKTRTLSVNWLNNLNDRTSLTLTGAATNVTFDGLATAGLVDYRNESINTTLSYTLSEQVETFVQYTYSRYIPEDVNSNSSEINSADLGVTWQVNEKLNIITSAGLNEIKSENNTNEKSWQASLSAQYTALRTNSYFSLSRSQSPGSTGSLNESNRFAVGWSYKLSERDNLALDFSWRQNLTLNKTETKQFSANYTRELSLSWDFRMSAEHKARDDKLTNVSSSSIMASLIYKLPDF